MNQVCTIVGFDSHHQTINLRVAPMPSTVEIGGEVTVTFGTDLAPATDSEAGSAVPIAHNKDCDVWDTNPDGIRKPCNCVAAPITCPECAGSGVVTLTGFGGRKIEPCPRCRGAEHVPSEDDSAKLRELAAKLAKCLKDYTETFTRGSDVYGERILADAKKAGLI